MSNETQCRVYELRAIASAEAPTAGVMESDLCPIRFRAYVAQQGQQHHLLVQGETGLPEGSILGVTCLFAPLARRDERYVLRGVPMPVREGQFAGLLLNFPTAPRPGIYTVRVRFTPDAQPEGVRPYTEEMDEWTLAAEILIDRPDAKTSVCGKRLEWRVECLSAELRRIEEQLETVQGLLEEAQGEEERDSWRLEVLLLHDLSVIYRRRLADREAELESFRKRCRA